jgi:hypothetical protein
VSVMVRPGTVRPLATGARMRGREQGRAVATMSHNERLQTIGESTRKVVDRIVATWNRATAVDVDKGTRWYDEGESLVDDLAAEHRLSRETVAAVIAQLSPRTTWGRNVEGARKLLATGEAPGCLGANVARALVALESADPLATLNGPKVSRFARNLLGDRYAVTVDVWAARVALGDQGDGERVLDRVGVYPAIEHAYRVAAERVGVDPTTMQATTWVVARNGRAA